MENKELNIQINHYHYQCGDGCCDNYGTNILVNGKKLLYEGGDTEIILKEILEDLGYKVNIETNYDSQ